ncbi:MAG: NfeD family protein [Planctomycetota bacterium]
MPPSPNTAAGGWPYTRPPLLSVLGAVGAVAIVSAVATAENDATGPGQPKPPTGAAEVVSVPLPIEGSDDQAIKGSLQRALSRLLEQPADGESRPVLVLEFTPSPRAALPDGRGSEFERALSLARFLAGPELTAVKTVAFLPASVKGHAVLPVLACEEIAMAPAAEIGDADADEPADRPIEAFVARAYREIASARRTVPEALAVGFVDRGAEVYRLESADRIDLVLAEDLADAEQQRAIVNRELLVPSGATGAVSGRSGRELGFVKYLADKRAGLARALGASLETLAVPGADGAWSPVILDVRGRINPTTVRRIKTMIGDEIKQRGANWIGLRIDSTGGDLDACIQLAQDVAGLREAEVRTVAYVPSEASGAAALVALAADQLVMHPGAKLGGGFRSRGEADKPNGDEGQRKLQPKPNADRPAPPAEATADEIEAAVITVRNTLAPKTERSGSLLAAMIDPDLRVYRYTNKETGAVDFFSQQQAEELPNAAAWLQGEELTVAGQSLELDAEQAAALGVAWRVVETFDELALLYGLAGEVPVAKPNWALEFVQALASPQLAMLLLLVAFIGVYVELNMPGIGIGGFIAAVAFMLFFWSKFTAQTADWLEVLLFLTGIVCILLEVFVLPGVGVFGFGGALLVLTSLILASQTFLVPKTESQLAELRTSLATVAGSFAAMLVAAIVLRRYLPHTPLFRSIQLAPAASADRIDLDLREAVADYAHLVGRTGVATTDLLPSGRAEVDGELVDVITQGGLIDRGAEIQVVSAKANRVVVKAVRG